MTGVRQTEARVSRTWTADEEEQLRQLLNGGEYVQVIARQMGRTQAAVSARAGKLGLSVRSAPGRKPSIASPSAT